MQYKEIVHTMDVANDIKNEFDENIHSLIYLSNAVYERLKRQERVYRQRIHLDSKYHYDDGSLMSYVSTLNSNDPTYDKVISLFSITHETGNMYMVVYYEEYEYDGCKKQKVKEFYSVTDIIERIVYIK